VESTEQDGFLLVLTTCPNQETAEQIALEVISNYSAACVNILPGLLSLYRWQGKIEKDQEHLLIIKTHKVKYPVVAKRIREIHPYQVPEIIAISINQGSSEYLAWLKQCLS
jgi:periplasmic divalent cation tolerance protein